MAQPAGVEAGMENKKITETEHDRDSTDAADTFAALVRAYRATRRHSWRYDE